MRATLLVLLVCPFVLGQREETDAEWQKHHAKIEYGGVLLGKHKIDELKTGTSWRMGQNSPSLLKTDMALLVGDYVVVPGVYRVGVYRRADKEFLFMVEGGSLGDAPGSSPVPAYAKGDMGKPEKPTKALEVTLKPDGKSTTPLQNAKVVVNYGENQLVSAVTLVGTKSTKSGGWTLDGFSIPAETVEKRIAENKPIPLAALKKETGDKKMPFAIWNVVVGKDSAELWPAPVAPPDAFADVKGLNSGAMVKATSVKWEDAKDSKPFLEPVKLDVAKGKSVTIVFAAGKQTCTLSAPEPSVDALGK